MTKRPEISMEMDLRELRYFVCVAELESFSKAADRLRIAQPAISRQVRRLEDKLGTQLLVRRGRGVEVTEMGAILLRRAYAIFRQLEQAREDVLAQADVPSGTITIGIPPAAGEFLIPALVARSRELYPNIALRIIEGFSGFIYERLLSHEINLAVLHNPPCHRDLIITPLLEEQMYLIAPPDFGSGARQSVTIDEMRDLPLILPRKPHSLRLLVENAVADRRHPLRIDFEVDGLGIIKAMVGYGLGYTVLTYGAVHQEVTESKMSAVLIRPPGIAWTLAIATRADQRSSRALAEVARLCREETHSLVENGIWRGHPRFPVREIMR